MAKPILSERRSGEVLDALLGVRRCIECGAEIEDALAHLGSLTCAEHRPVNTPS
jgi:hypothetical protein